MAYDAPKPEQFADADGYIDWSDYDYACYQWRQSIPDLFERWCPAAEKPEAPAAELSLAGTHNFFVAELEA
jgi:hypothetical protein